MASVTPFIRTSTKKTEKANVRFRLIINNEKSFYHTSEIEINPRNWDNKRYEIKTKVVCNDAERKSFNKKVYDRKNLILEIYDTIADKENFNSQQLDKEIDKILHPDIHPEESKEKSIFDFFEEFLNKRDSLSEARKNHYKVVIRTLQRFELYKQKKNKNFELALDTITLETLYELTTFLQTEPEIKLIYPEIYEAVPGSRTPQQKGKNTIRGFFIKIKTFYKWCTPNYTTNDPFLKFEIKSETYGTPFYITVGERNQLLNFDLSHKPKLAIQRDIFVFQCLIGCRIGDLYRLKKTSVNNNFISYIARKTKDKNPLTVKVPLNDTAVKILAKYEPLVKDDRILPFISEQKYNDAIKLSFKLAGINRIVTILNPTTGETEQQALYEVASSHLARRTFIGNLYKKVKDPNLIGSMTGHSEGSKAFARYRDIDDEDKMELVKMLD